MTETLYKICSSAEWSHALARSEYAGSADDTRDGFIHLSCAHQMRATAAKYYAGRNDLVLVSVEAASLGAGLRFEPSRGGDLFPHLYGVLPTRLAVRVDPLPWTGSEHVWPSTLPMQLWYAASSPFAREVRVVVHELALGQGVEEIELNPWHSPRLRALNPLSKVPTLLCSDGQTLYDSRVICQYLAARGNARLLARDGEARWRALRLQALVADACSAAGRLFASEQRGTDVAIRPRFEAAIEATLDQLEREQLSSDAPDLGDIAAAILPGYLSFRWPDRDAYGARASLRGFVQAMEARPSFLATRYAAATSATR